MRGDPFIPPTSIAGKKSKVIAAISFLTCRSIGRSVMKTFRNLFHTAAARRAAIIYTTFHTTQISNFSSLTYSKSIKLTKRIENAFNFQLQIIRIARSSSGEKDSNYQLQCCVWLTLVSLLPRSSIHVSWSFVASCLILKYNLITFCSQLLYEQLRQKQTDFYSIFRRSFASLCCVLFYFIFFNVLPFTSFQAA